MKRTSILLLGAGLALLLALLPGCNSQDTRNLERDTTSLARDTGQALGSASLNGKVASVLALRKGVDMSGLHIESQGSTVIISGHVRNQEEKSRIRDTVEGIRGVDKVDLQNLRVEALAGGRD